jgi:fumarate hydratase class II
LNIHIGYENAAKIVKKAYNENLTLKEAALGLNLMTEKQFDNWVVPTEMIHPIQRKL